MTLHHLHDIGDRLGSPFLKTNGSRVQIVDAVGCGDSDGDGRRDVVLILKAGWMGDIGPDEHGGFRHTGL